MFRKHLFYVSSDQLTAYQWQRGQLSAGTVFSNDRAGHDAFIEYLDRAPYAPAYLLADLIEEDFQRINLPHVAGRSGRQLVQRRLVQQYRETPYRHVWIQGRATEGRQDDIALLSALTNPAVVAPWIEALELLQRPLAGLYSATLMSTPLLPKLGVQHEHLLLVTQQSAGLRQTYFLNGKIKFSRLTPALDRDGAPVNIARETGKTQQFLTSIRLIGRGDALHTVILAPQGDLARLTDLCNDGPETRYQFIALEQAATRVGATPAALADTLLLSLLGKQAPASQYSLGPARRYFQLWRARMAMYGSGAVIMLGALVWVSTNLWQYVQASRAAERMYSEADQYDARYRAALSTMPPAVAPTISMKAAVTVARMLQNQGPQPLPIMVKLGEALEQVPQVRITQLDWKVALPGVRGDNAGSASVQSGGQPGASVQPLSSLLLGVPNAPPQSLRVEAEIAVPQNNYRTVVETMNAFTQTLARQPRMTVEIEQLPLDTRSNVKLMGKAGSANSDGDTKPKFSLILMWNP
ncbi:MAG: hypothetical protein ACEQSK_14785 [Sphingomonadaceae bacterium]